MKKEFPKNGPLNRSGVPFAVTRGEGFHERDQRQSLTAFGIRETAGDHGTGVRTSAERESTQPWASFLLVAEVAQRKHRWK
jgi:hypothetical protein